VSLHHFPGVIGQDGQCHWEIFAIESCSFFWHFQSCHQLIEHVDIRFKPDSDSSDIILLVDEFGLIEDAIECGAEDLASCVAIDGDEVVIDEGGDWCAGIADAYGVAAAIDDYPSSVVLAPSHIIYTASRGKPLKTQIIYRPSRSHAGRYKRNGVLLRSYITCSRSNPTNTSRSSSLRSKAQRANCTRSPRTTPWLCSLSALRNWSLTNCRPCSMCPNYKVPIPSFRGDCRWQWVAKTAARFNLGAFFSWAAWVPAQGGVSSCERYRQYDIGPQGHP